MTDAELDRFTRGLRVAMEMTGWKPAPLASAAGLSDSTIRDMYRYRSSPKVSTAEAIAAVLGMTIDDIIALGGATVQRPVVAVAGKVGAGARVPLHDGYEKGDGIYHVACPPQIKPSGVVAVEVEGDSMSPMYQSGHVLFFTRHTYEGILADDIGHPCVVEDEEGNAWVKLVKRGSAPGLWNLISLNPSAESVWDVRIKWAARVRLAMPAELVQRV